MNLFQVITGGAGALLVYCGVKGFNPRSVISYAFGGPKPVKIGADGTWDSQEFPLDSGVAPLDGSKSDQKAFPDGPDAGTDGDNLQSPLSFNPTTDPPPNATGI